MKLRFEKFNNSHLEGCAEIIKTTWKFEEDFKNSKRKDLIYKYYVLACGNYCEHLEVIVDENDNVKGLLFGSIENTPYSEKIKYKFKELKLNLWALHHLIVGDFGDRKTALMRKDDFRTINELGELHSYKFDSEINLFILSPELRGMGYGKMLMDRYMEFCKDNQLRTVFLWTDLSCTFSFYEKYGFKLYKKFYHKSIKEKSRDKLNGMIYCIDINSLNY